MYTEVNKKKETRTKSDTHGKDLISIDVVFFAGCVRIDISRCLSGCWPIYSGHTSRCFLTKKYEPFLHKTRESESLVCNKTHTIITKRAQTTNTTFQITIMSHLLPGDSRGDRVIVVLRRVEENEGD